MRPSIKTSLIGLFASLALIAAVQGIVSLRKLNAIGARIELLDSNALPSVNAAHTLSTWVMRTRLWQFRYLIADTDTERALSSKTIADLSQNLEKTKTYYVDLISSAEERETFEDFCTKWKILSASWNDIIDIDPKQRDLIYTKFRGPINAEYIAVTGAAQKLVAFNVAAGAAAGVAAREEQAQAMRLTQIMLVLAAVTALVAIVFALLGISRPIERMTVAMRRLSQNDAETTIPNVGRGDEIGSMAAAVQVFKDNLIRTRQLEADTAQARLAAEEQRKAGMRQMADGFEAAVGGIIGMVSSSATELQATAQTMTATATETASQSTTVAAAAEEAASNVNTVAAAAEELGSSVQEIGRQVAGSAELAQRAVHEADQTGTLVQELSAAVSRIGDVVGLISTIAGQTNLLALNATIEAARAGAAGKGFAVVASEVKALAEQTAKATSEISGQIAQIQASTGQAVTSIGGITGRIREISDVASSIAAAVEQQGAATQEIVRNVSQAAMGTGEVTSNISSVAGAAEETGAAANQVLGAASELSRQSEHLSAEVERFLATVRAA
ncbi:methyl-accepting chemotaxis protein [Methylobacterium sp. E-005]|uniref:methyl-accepting chemotaxis protein n=1 Tax=Methylobacterium sp. E-005 TaxID=2836549 RepID=UPI001FBB74CC|nr:methyl-accepting chemotaxis protein [Methylobacterium sp. E-005]MCJ2084866.1 methyl-accepting chemotaxis protein [Methylobacterium sp. E-005]